MTLSLKGRLLQDQFQGLLLCIPKLIIKLQSLHQRKAIKATLLFFKICIYKVLLLSFSHQINRANLKVVKTKNEDFKT